MTNLFSKFLPEIPAGSVSRETREKYGAACGLVGICANLLLSAAKFMIGLMTGSVAVSADAFNNLSDAGSSAITLLTFRLSAKPPDREHPFGHGRYEYVGSLIISFIILLVGIEFLRSSIDRIFHPGEVNAGPIAIAVLFASIPVKLLLSHFYRAAGRKINSQTLTACALDSRNDCIATVVSLLAVTQSGTLSLPVDGIAGMLVAFFIIYSGIKIARDTVNPLLGIPPDKEFTDRIKGKILSYPGIAGVHDIIVHNYGPGRIIVSAHAEVLADSDLLVAHDAIDLAEKQIAESEKIAISLHMDPIDLNCPETARLHTFVSEILKSLSPDISFHDFRVVTGPTHTNLIFDILVPHDFTMTSSALKKRIGELVKASDKNYYTVITVDKPFEG